MSIAYSANFVNNLKDKNLDLIKPANNLCVQNNTKLNDVLTQPSIQESQNNSSILDSNEYYNPNTNFFYMGIGEIPNNQQDLNSNCETQQNSLEHLQSQSDVSSESNETSSSNAWNLSLQFHKTQLCPFFQKGHCRKNSGCTYAHGSKELKSAPNLYKTKLCKLWQLRLCNDKNCRFAHGRQELRFTDQVYKTRICHFWSIGDCSKGKLCRHAHGYEELRYNQITSFVNNNNSNYKLNNVDDLECLKSQSKHINNMLFNSNNLAIPYNTYRKFNINTSPSNISNMSAMKKTEDTTTVYDLFNNTPSSSYLISSQLEGLSHQSSPLNKDDSLKTVESLSKSICSKKSASNVNNNRIDSVSYNDYSITNYSNQSIMNSEMSNAIMSTDFTANNINILDNQNSKIKFEHESTTRGHYLVNHDNLCTTVGKNHSYPDELDSKTSQVNDIPTTPNINNYFNNDDAMKSFMNGLSDSNIFMYPYEESENNDYDYCQTQSRFIKLMSNTSLHSKMTNLEDYESYKLDSPLNAPLTNTGMNSFDSCTNTYMCNSGIYDNSHTEDSNEKNTIFLGLKCSYSTHAMNDHYDLEEKERCSFTKSLSSVIDTHNYDSFFSNDLSSMLENCNRFNPDISSDLKHGSFFSLDNFSFNLSGSKTGDFTFYN